MTDLTISVVLVVLLVDQTVATCAIDEHPYMIAVVRNIGFEFVCSGTLLSQHYALTGFNCVKAKECLDKKFSVLAGASVLKIDPTLNPFAKISPVWKCNFYATAENATFGVFAVLHFREPIFKNHLIEYVKLATLQDLYNTRIEEVCVNGTEVSWTEQKSTDIRKSLPPDKFLRCTNVYTLSADYCLDVFEKEEMLIPNKFCTQALEKRCYGNMGSPLVCRNKQFGILHLAPYCDKGYPSIHVMIYSFNDILDHYIPKSERSISIPLKIFKISSYTLLFVIYFVTLRIL